MNLETIGIPISFVILSAVLLWFVIGARGYWWVKMIVMAVTLFFSIAMWNSLEDLLGWPTQKSLPDKFQVHWAVVDEPSKITRSQGGIYLWVKNLSPSKDNSFLSFIPEDLKKESRLHKMPYTRTMHEQMNKVLGELKKGKKFIGEKKGNGVGEADGQANSQGKGKGKGKGYGLREGKGGKGNGFDFSQEQEFIFHELPPPLVPRKITGEDPPGT